MVRKRFKKRKRFIKEYTGVKVTDLTFPDDYDIGKQGVTQSLIDVYETCTQKFLYKINRWHDPSNSTTFFGSVMHDLLDRLYNHKWNEKKITTKTIDKWVTEHFSQYGTKTVSGIPKEREALEEVKVFAILSEYVKFYKDDFEEMKFTDVEGEFEVNYRGIVLRGKKDGRYVDREGGIWLLDHKCKGRIEEEPMMLRLSFDLQLLFYVLADEIEHKENVVGCLYNIIRNPGNKLKVGQSLNDYQNELIERIQEKPEYYFMRHEIVYNKNDKKRFKYDLNNILWEMCKTIKGDFPVRRKGSSCEQPYRCEFLSACAKNKLTGFVQGDKLFPELNSI